MLKLEEGVSSSSYSSVAGLLSMSSERQVDVYGLYRSAQDVQRHISRANVYLSTDGP